MSSATCSDGCWVSTADTCMGGHSKLPSDTHRCAACTYASSCSCATRPAITRLCVTVPPPPLLQVTVLTYAGAKLQLSVPTLAGPGGSSLGARTLQSLRSKHWGRTQHRQLHGALGGRLCVRGLKQSSLEPCHHVLNCFMLSWAQASLAVMLPGGWGLA